MMNRRAVMKAMISCGALVSVGGLLPRQVMAGWNVAAFSAATQEDAIQMMFAAEPVVSDDIHLQVPRVAVDGSVVPVSVTVSLANVESISLFLEGSPNPLVAEFMLPEGTQAEVLTRIRMAKTTVVTAVVKADGQLLSASQEVEVKSIAKLAPLPTEANMTDIMAVRAKMKGEATQVKLAINHPMQNGLSSDEATGELTSAAFLQEITVLHGEKTVFEANLGINIAANPFIGFSFIGAVSDDELIINWVENTGKTGSQTAVIK